MRLRILAALSLITLAATGVALAQSDNNAARDDRRPPPRAEPTDGADDVMMRRLREAKVGVVLMDLEFVIGLNGKCDGIDVAMGRLVSGAWRYSVVTGPTPGTLFNQSRFMNAFSLEPGEYFVVGIVCSGGKVQAEGPFAKFQVNAGEAVNLGVLKLHYQSKDLLFGFTGAMKKSVEGLSPGRKAEFAKAYPNLFPKAVERRMEIVGPAESGMTKQGKSVLTGQPCPRGVPICP